MLIVGRVLTSLWPAFLVPIMLWGLVLRIPMEQRLPVRAGDVSRSPEYFLVAGVRKTDAQAVLIALASCSRGLLYARSRADARAAAKEALQEVWPDTDVVWAAGDFSNYSLQISPDTAAGFSSALSSYYKQRIPDDTAFQEYGIEVRLPPLPDDAGGPQTVRLVIHRGNFADIFVYEVAEGSVAPLYTVDRQGEYGTKVMIGGTAAIISFVMLVTVRYLLNRSRSSHLPPWN